MCSIIYAPKAFNRLSMGVDFNKQVQQLVNREQDEAFIFALIERASAGLPLDQYRSDLRPAEQTPESFAFTLQRVAELNPIASACSTTRICRTCSPPSAKIKDADLPGAQQKLDILQQSIAFLTGAGYQFIGMDHFACPDDELAIAQRRQAASKFPWLYHPWRQRSAGAGRVGHQHAWRQLCAEPERAEALL